MDGTLLLVPLMLPVLGLLLALALGGRHLGRLALALLLVGLAGALAIAAAVLVGGTALEYHLGAWVPPLGVTLKADGLSAVMLLASALVLLGVGLYAQRGFAVPAGAPESRTALTFWMLLMGIWAGLDAAFLAQDLFTLFVALELLTFSAVPLVALDGRAETLAAALRYLLFALLGSVLYLLGAVLIYGSFGTLDIALIAQRLAGVSPLPPPVLAAAVLMTVGLLAKTALFPLHLWLPPAHAGAPPAASAILSALVVKASFFLILRIWFDLLPGLLALPGVEVLGALGAAAILFGNLVALRQARLKLLIAYSTLAQLGYLFLIFPLAAHPQTGALTAGLVQVVAHACAKAAMFMAAGLIAAALGHDRIRNLSGIGRALPLTCLAFALIGIGRPGEATAVAALLTDTGDWGKVWAGVWPVLIVAALVWGLRDREGRGRRVPKEAPAAALPGTLPWPSLPGRVLDRTDVVLRQWPVGGLLLLALAIVLWGAMIAGAGPS